MNELEKKLKKAHKLIKESTELLDWFPNQALLYKVEDSLIRAIKILCPLKRS